MCLQAPPGDPEFAYLFSERDRADRKYRLRLAALQKLLSARIGRTERRSDHFTVNSLWGQYQIGEASGSFEEKNWYLHWGYVQHDPATYGFPKRPPRSALKLNGEYFISMQEAEKLKEKWNRTIDPNNDGVVDAGRPERLYEKAETIFKESTYEILRPSQWREHLNPEQQPAMEVPVPEPQLPPPASREVVKSLRNRLNYLKRRTRAQQT